jgi:dTDP-4-dehydrorhamnose 3,5-epimerase
MPSKNSKIKIFAGGLIADKRGRVSFVNNFHFKGVKRFYQIENSPSNPVRAFHGHMKEAKYFFVSSGSILLAAVKLDNPRQPSKKTPVYRKIISGKTPTIVYVPAGYANGFKSLEKNTVVLVFSTASLSESQADDYRYPADYWNKNIW